MRLSAVAFEVSMLTAGDEAAVSAGGGAGMALINCPSGQHETAEQQMNRPVCIVDTVSVQQLQDV